MIVKETKETRAVLNRWRKRRLHLDGCTSNLPPNYCHCSTIEKARELATLRAENERLRKALETIRDMDTGPDKLAQSVADYELSGKVAPT